MMSAGMAQPAGVGGQRVARPSTLVARSATSVIIATMRKIFQRRAMSGPYSAAAQRAQTSPGVVGRAANHFQQRFQRWPPALGDLDRVGRGVRHGEDARDDQQIGQLAGVGGVEVVQRVPVGAGDAQRDRGVGRLVLGGAERLERLVDALAPGQHHLHRRDPRIAVVEAPALGVDGDVDRRRIAGPLGQVGPDVLGGEAQDRRDQERDCPQPPPYCTSCAARRRGASLASQ